MSRKDFKYKILNTINKAERADILSKRFDIFIMTLIVLNVTAVIIETVDSIYNQYSNFFDAFEVFSVIIFTIEYFIRVWLCTLDPKYRHPFWGRVRYIFSLEALIDLLAIVPFYLPLIISADGRILRIMRITRILRIFKLGRYSVAFQLIIKVVQKKKEELLITVSLLMILLILSSSLMYFIESEAQPEVFTSIPATMWWSVATLTTVGYGDVYPITPMGKLLGAFIAILGIGVFALPTGMVASGFESEISQKSKKKDED
ncbi:MAG TPA: ion transporter [Cyclobacteriaceae bacterium]